MTLEIDVLTLFPAMFDGPLAASIPGRIQEQGLATIRIHDLPVRVRSVGNHEIVRQGEHALAVASAVGHVTFVCLRALELAGSVRILSDCGNRKQNGRRQQSTQQELYCLIHVHFVTSCLKIDFVSSPAKR